MLSKYLVSFVVLIFLGGCATTNAIYGDGGKKFLPTKAVSVLQVPPQKPYVVIAKLKTTGIPGMSYKTLLADMISKAKNIGADAIIVSKLTHAMSRREVYRMPHRTQAVVRPPVSVPILNAVAIRYRK
ncbi:hypothetical protein [Acidihalobacter prosperus]|uniref:hypothetical protein n=1 Tax=Acidihalobacter prosperus TaxID=160660 RepID=UPI00050431E3|nr:hypothetical protein [Acidihalobacter prosperus]